MRSCERTLIDQYVFSNISFVVFFFQFPLLATYRRLKISARPSSSVAEDVVTPSEVTPLLIWCGQAAVCQVFEGSVTRTAVKTLWSIIDLLESRYNSIRPRLFATDEILAGNSTTSRFLNDLFVWRIQCMYSPNKVCLYLLRSSTCFYSCQTFEHSVVCEKRDACLRAFFCCRDVFVILVFCPLVRIIQ